MTFPLDGYDCYWASPPCQIWCRMRKLNLSQNMGKDYPALIGPMRERLTGRIYVIENVPHAPLQDPIMLCGSSFGLPIRRHRWFECSFPAWQILCAHYNEVPDKPPLHRLFVHSRVVGCYGHGRGKGDSKQLWSAAMGIDWMTRREITQAVPPIYSEFLGKYMMETVRAQQ